MRASVAAAAALLAGALVLPATASADGTGTPFVVAHGHSLYGVPWRISIGEEPPSRYGQPRSAILQFSFGGPDEYNEAGYFSSFPLPVPRPFVFSANSGSEIDSHSESDTSGFAARRAVELVAKMSDGSRLVIETQTAPTRLTDRFHWLRGLCFFDQFYLANIEPTEILAYGRDGRLLERIPG